MGPLSPLSRGTEVDVREARAPVEAEAEEPDLPRRRLESASPRETRQKAGGEAVECGIHDVLPLAGCQVADRVQNSAIVGNHGPRHEHPNDHRRATHDADHGKRDQKIGPRSNTV